ncbi:MAG: lipid A biosynthesis acyltransferase [Flavobacteriaceae bacterium]|nr:lipid A biosynthesis acyltransferase [Flavobacteriaceae bacterium]
MNLLVYIILYPLIWIISKSSFRLIYLFSDFLYLILYHVISYRKKLVRKNLALALPEKTFLERKIIEKKYYKHLSDLFLESFKSLNISEVDIKKRYSFKNIELLDELYKKKKNIILMGGHYASWEWFFIIDRLTDYRINAIYKKLSNKHFDSLIKKIRSKYNGNLISTKNTFKEILKNTKLKGLNIYGFASDQSPKKNKATYWNNFLNNFVPFHTGAEIIAKKYDMAVVYMNVEKVKRGYYLASFELITDKPKKYKDFKITEDFIKLLENQIFKAPEYYTWTHNRFKHRKTN